MLLSRNSWILFAALLIAWPCGQVRCAAQDADLQIPARLAGGEFAAARHRLDQLPAAERDPILAQIAAAQGSSGETVAAGGTLRQIQSLSSRDEAVGGASLAGAGGGSFADFQSLIDLIQTTVVPDTWEALGGPSTMAPYPQGVYVDAEGTVQPCDTFAAGSAVDDLKSLLSSPREALIGDVPLAWRQPAGMRCVSLRRLLDEWTRLRISGLPAPESMAQMAGLSRVQYIFLHDRDIVLAAPVGGIETSRGWHRDRVSGLSTLRLDFFLTCLASAIGQKPFGCTIDPTTAGLQQAAALAQAVQSDEVPIGKAADAMVAALGMQRVEVFGTAGDTPIGYLMVEADRHMKQLALGFEPMPPGAVNYLDMIDATIDQGPPNELLLRLWFTSAPCAVRADTDRQVFEIAGTPIRLSGQNERAMVSGQRGHVTGDVRTAAFVDDFNRNWNAIRSEYPVYGALESVYHAASAAELLRRHADTPPQRALLAALAAGGSQSVESLPTPRQVKSIARLHSVRKGRKLHHVLLASGGVAVDVQQTLAPSLADYPSLSSLPQPAESQPAVVQRWWWNAR
jgi:hypothetical protein